MTDEMQQQTLVIGLEDERRFVLDPQELRAGDSPALWIRAALKKLNAGSPMRTIGGSLVWVNPQKIVYIGLEETADSGRHDAAREALRLPKREPTQEERDKALEIGRSLRTGTGSAYRGPLIRSNKTGDRTEGTE